MNVVSLSLNVLLNYWPCTEDLCPSVLALQGSDNKSDRNSNRALDVTTFLWTANIKRLFCILWCRLNLKRNIKTDTLVIYCYFAHFTFDIRNSSSTHHCRQPSPCLTAGLCVTDRQSCNQGGESPESRSDPFNQTPCRKGFNLLIREGLEVRSSHHGQEQLWDVTVVS